MQCNAMHADVYLRPLGGLRHALVWVYYIHMLCMDWIGLGWTALHFSSTSGRFGLVPVYSEYETKRNE